LYGSFSPANVPSSEQLCQIPSVPEKDDSPSWNTTIHIEKLLDMVDPGQTGPLNVQPKPDSSSIDPFKCRRSSASSEKDRFL